MLTELEIFSRRKIRQYFDSGFRKADRDRLKNQDFVIVSRNCWGGQIYRWLDLPYNTPFVGLFFYGPCYIKLLKNFDHYMACELEFSEVSSYGGNRQYPIGLLKDIEVHFKHYESEEEARDKWNRRKERMLSSGSKDNYFFMICDRRGTGLEDFKEFHDLPFKNKVSFAYNELPGHKGKNHIQVYKDVGSKREMIPNGKKMFKLTFLYFDLIHWLNTGEMVRTRFKN